MPPAETTRRYSTPIVALLFFAILVQLFVSSPVIGAAAFTWNANVGNLVTVTCRQLRSKKSIDPTILFRSKRMHSYLLQVSDGGNHNSDIHTPGSISADSIYFDIEVANEPIGRLVFHVTNPSPLPKHAENIVQLAKGSRCGIDPKAQYKGCEFDYSPAAVEDGMGRYRWSHQLKGRGRNGIGRADELITDPKSQAACCHSTFGGQYYGDLYTRIENDPGVLLTVPVVGPGYGSSKFSIVRVEESPKEWKETLLLNSGVIGRLDGSSLEVLHAMARQRRGPPTVVASGILE
mmetsp:Transcript_730/g.1620  ORF Transcript_730/g.1620 Transcript_730/m.1620 type:complete len:291 (+) Transcript_730:95-967(+)|eukprot:CAMPEP_0168165066 /NCGR_PEP_ID=MMETSP0139_2-20121125/1283_1 /TAXON_ID=44445 /ORGANISM="Pseudo-nitzschia australis, Strain 10249 10 AB" /LENGTH=290 /DNA_ID=CAMNT_0008082147 /DNA_START=38 /DNA_END=910 /DNA_ORIENTATION=+